MYLKRLDVLVTEKLGQHRKWNLPSRVFSDAEYVYPGFDIRVRRLVEKLDRLGYRNTGADIATPGDYALTQEHLDVYLHDFEYPQENFKGFPVRFELLRNVIERIEDITTHTTIELVRLEPEVIAPIFDERMEDRTIITLQDVPPKLLEAIILIEDERFFRHHGVDPIGILRAAAANLVAMRIVQGGSTLTQQLVKNYFLSPRKSFLRKANEALMALVIELRFSKAEILQAYLNEIYLGQRGASSVSGVSEAAKFYFAKNVGQLSVAESALLAGMIKSPNAYSPFLHLERARERRDVVLARMKEEELLDDKEYAVAIAEPIITPKHVVRVVTAPYFIDFVKQELAAFYPQEVLESEGLRIFTTLDMTAQRAAEDVITSELLRMETDLAYLLPKNHPEGIQGCLLALQPSTGFIRAMVGGREYAKSQFNRCIQANRQPGSTFKPFVYLTALDPERSRKAFTASSLLDDVSFTMESGGEEWSPKNYDEEEHGKVTLRTALEKSYNIATARLALDVGLEEIVTTARDAGITSPLTPVPAVALGAFEVSPLEMAVAYTIFPNGGVRAEPIAVRQVVTKEGQLLEREEIRMKRRFDPEPIFLTTHLLKGVIDRGTGQSVRARGFDGPAAGKTGTTSNYRDAWFVGFTPELLTLTWVGYDDNAEMKASGATAAIPLWTAFMKDVAPESDRDFPSPRHVVLIKVDPATGGLSDSSCPNFIVEAFLEGTEPDYSCESVSLGTRPASQELF